MLYIMKVMRTLLVLWLMLALPVSGFASTQMVLCKEMGALTSHHSGHQGHVQHHPAVNAEKSSALDGLFCKCGCPCQGHCATACATVLGVTSLSYASVKLGGFISMPLAMPAHAMAAFHLDPFRPPIFAAT